MSLTMALSLPFALIAFVGLHGASAQITSDVTCLPAWQGLYNSKGQSPCLVSAYLGSVCNNGKFNVYALNEGESYPAPTAAQTNECQCSTVKYNMMAGCSTCQNATFVSWSSWSSSCPQVYVETFPGDIPQDTAVPGWAYDDFTNSTFDPSQVLQDNSPESTATRQQSTDSASADSSASATASSSVSGDSISSSATSSSSISISLSSTSPSSSSPSSSSPSSSSPSSKSNTGAIAGGVVGGVLGVAFLGFFLYRRNQKKAHKIVHMNGVQANLTGGPSTFGGANGRRGQYTSVPYTSKAYEHINSIGAVGGGKGSSPMAQQKLYVPKDPTAFRKPPLPGLIHGQNMGQPRIPSPPPSYAIGATSQAPNQSHVL